MRALEARRLLAAAPSISVTSVITVPAGKSIQIPVAGDTATGSSLTYTVAGGRKFGLSSAFHASSNPWLDLYTTNGSLRFQLLADVAPNAVRHISGLVDSGFYDGLTFHRIVNVNGFKYAQGGDPNGDGTGGPQFKFDDEFNLDAIFSGSGQLATANVTTGSSGKDANGSQFIITGGPARSLDFNHTIFGQLVRGGKSLTTILNAETQDYKPDATIRIKEAQIVQDTTDAVLQLKAGKKLGQSSVTVTATDSSGHATTRVITVKVVKDTDSFANDPPVLQPIAPITAMPGDTVVIPVKASDLEGDDYDIGGDYTGNELVSTAVNQLEKTIVVKIADDATGPIELTVGVKGSGAIYRGGITLPVGSDPRTLASGLYDTQQVTIAVGDLSIQRAVPASDEFVAIPATTLDDRLIATFRVSADAVDANTSTFAVQLDWGDGAVTSDAQLREVSDGQFAVYGTHVYDTAGTRPITVDVTADNGASARIYSQIRVADPVALVGTTLTLTGTEEADRFVIRRGDDGSIVVNDTTWPAGSVDHIEARLYGGDDALDANADELPDLYVDGGDGNDVIQSGPGNDTIVGGAGNDLIGGNGGDDLINGGDGNDTILGGSGKNVLYGDAGDDRITGSNGRDAIYGGDGNDRLYGRNGDDTLDGGAGVDRIYGEGGNDLLIGGSGNDRIYGGDGDDTLYGKGGNDVLEGGPGNNVNADAEQNELPQSL